jgi:hypothetical protein
MQRMIGDGIPGGAEDLVICSEMVTLLTQHPYAPSKYQPNQHLIKPYRREERPDYENDEGDSSK